MITASTSFIAEQLLVARGLLRFRAECLGDRSGTLLSVYAPAIANCRNRGVLIRLDKLFQQVARPSTAPDQADARERCQPCATAAETAAVTNARRAMFIRTVFCLPFLFHVRG
ncbi:MAG TPA: hypothetical protein VER03_16830 [Bryobacteraceae bacterium]|nr:hypothetical protein [Bryobacteraceae bacterium]